MFRTISKISLVTFCLVCLMVFSTYGTSHAVVRCTVKVESVFMTAPSTTHTGAMVVLKNTTGATIASTWTNNTTRYFYLSKPLGNQGLAVFLTALSNKTKVTVGIAGTAVNNSLISYVAVTQVAQ